MNVKNRNTYFAEKFSITLNEWKKRTGRKQADFAEEVGVSEKIISAYKKGEKYPSRHLNKICEVLGVSEDYFYPTSHGDKYRYSTGYMNELGEERIKYSKVLGLNLTFLQAVRAITQFDNVFPLYSPLKGTYDKYLLEIAYTRMDFSDSAPMDSPLNVFQLQRDGKVITLSRADLEFLKDVQDKVSEYISFLFYSRAHEIKAEAERATAASRKPDEPGWFNVDFLNAAELNEIDKYGHYVDRGEDDD